MKTFTQVEITKYDCQGGILYEIPRELYKGTGIIIFNPLEEYLNETINIKKDLLGFEPNSLVAEITDFFPNGLTNQGLKNLIPYMRRGTGTDLLQKMTMDAIQNEANILYVKTDQDTMRNFLRKKQFYELPSEKPNHTNFYKKL